MVKQNSAAAIVITGSKQGTSEFISLPVSGARLLNSYSLSTQLGKVSHNHLVTQPVRINFPESLIYITLAHLTKLASNPLDNVSKSAVKSLCESLSHSLRSTPISVSLLVPGYTWTKLTDSGEGKADDTKKPAAAWTGNQVAEYLFQEIEKDEFYIICPDSESLFNPLLFSFRFLVFFEENLILTIKTPPFHLAIKI